MNAHLAYKANVGVCHAPYGFDLLEHLVVGLVRAPHEVCYEQSCAAGHSLGAVDENFASLIQCCLQDAIGNEQPPHSG